MTSPAKTTFFNKKISLLWFLLLLIAFVGSGFYLIEHRPHEIQIIKERESCPAYMDQVRLSGRWAFTKPLLLTDLPTEDGRLLPIKNNIEQFVAQKKNEGVLSGISVYLRKLNNGG